MSKTRKTREVSLKSYYYGKGLTLRIPAESADRLDIDERDRIKLVYWDVDRWYEGHSTELFTPNQCRRIYTYFGATTDYFYKVELL